jgi:hypothetical protein
MALRFLTRDQIVHMHDVLLRRRQPLNGVGPIVKDAAPAKIATGAFPCQLKWDVDSTSTTATLAPPQICVVKGVNLLMTGGSMRRNGNAIAWTATLTVNDCSIVQYSTWTKM